MDGHSFVTTRGVGTRQTGRDRFDDKFVLTPSGNTNLAFKLDQVISTYVDHALVDGVFDSKFTLRN
jgi:hypothetical protein